MALKFVLHMPELLPCPGPCAGFETQMHGTGIPEQAQWSILPSKPKAYHRCRVQVSVIVRAVDDPAVRDGYG